MPVLQDFGARYGNYAPAKNSSAAQPVSELEFGSGRPNRRLTLNPPSDGSHTACSVSGLSNRVNFETKFRCTVPVGPLRCFSMMISDLARSASLISSWRL